MKISVAVCTCNGAAYIKEQLNSIHLQTRQPEQVVICDDASDDDTYSLLLSFQENAEFKVQVLKNKIRLGVRENFSQAIRLCNGEVIVLCDQDDVWHPEKLRYIESALQANPSIIGVFSDGQLIDQDSKPLPGKLWERVGFYPKAWNISNNILPFEALLKGNVVTGATMAFRSSLRDALLPIPSGWIHDYWIAFILSAYSKLALIDHPLIDYRCHSSQQLGVRRSLVERAGKVVAAERNVYLEAADKWQEAYQRLLSMGIERESNQMQMIHGLATHLKARGTLSDRRLCRIPVLLKESMNGNYFRYSLGVTSIIRDLVARQVP